MNLTPSICGTEIPRKMTGIPKKLTTIRGSRDEILLPCGPSMVPVSEGFHTFPGSRVYHWLSVRMISVCTLKVQAGTRCHEYKLLPAAGGMMSIQFRESNASVVIHWLNIHEQQTARLVAPVLDCLG